MINYNYFEVDAETIDSPILELLLDKDFTGNGSLFEFFETNIAPGYRKRLKDDVQSYVAKEETLFKQIDSAFCAPRYSESDVQLNTLYFPCDATKYAYMLALFKCDRKFYKEEKSKITEITNRWYRFYNQALPNNTSESCKLLVGAHQTLYFHNIKAPFGPPTDDPATRLFLLEATEIGRGIFVGFFVDWRYFIRNLKFNLRLLAQTGNQTKDPTIALSKNGYERRFPELAAVINAIDSLPFYVTHGFSSEFYWSSRYWSNWVEYLVEHRPYFCIRSLDGCSFPLAIDTILHFYGIRLFDLTPPSVSKERLEARKNTPQNVTIASDKIFRNNSVRHRDKIFAYLPDDCLSSSVETIDYSSFATAIKSLTCCPSEFRFCFMSRNSDRSDKRSYGIYDDSSYGLVYPENMQGEKRITAVIYQSWKKVDGYTFFAGLTHKQRPTVELSHVYVGCRRDVMTNGDEGATGYQYRCHRLYKCPDGQVAPHIDGQQYLVANYDVASSNLVEINNEDSGTLGNGALLGAKELNNGEAKDVEDVVFETRGEGKEAIKYRVYGRDTPLPIGIGSIHIESAHPGWCSNGCQFTAENSMKNNACTRVGELTENYQYGNYAYVKSAEGNATPEYFRLDRIDDSDHNYKEFKKGVKVLFQRNSKTNRFSYIAMLDRDDAPEAGNYIYIGDKEKKKTESSDSSSEEEEKEESKKINWNGMDVLSGSSSSATTTETVARFKDSQYVGFDIEDYKDIYKSVSIEWKGFGYIKTYSQVYSTSTDSYVQRIRLGDGLSGSLDTTHSVLTISNTSTYAPEAGDYITIGKLKKEEEKKDGSDSSSEEKKEGEESAEGEGNKEENKKEEDNSKAITWNGFDTYDGNSNHGKNVACLSVDNQTLALSLSDYTGAYKTASLKWLGLGVKIGDYDRGVFPKVRFGYGFKQGPIETDGDVICVQVDASKLKQDTYAPEAGSYITIGALAKPDTTEEEEENKSQAITWNGFDVATDSESTTATTQNVARLTGNSDIILKTSEYNEVYKSASIEWAGVGYYVKTNDCEKFKKLRLERGLAGSVEDSELTISLDDTVISNYEAGDYIIFADPETTSDKSSEQKSTAKKISWTGLDVYKEGESEPQAGIASLSETTHISLEITEKESFKDAKITWNGFAYGNSTSETASGSTLVTALNCGDGLTGNVADGVLTLEVSANGVEYSGGEFIEIDEQVIDWTGFAIGSSESGERATGIYCGKGLQSAVRGGVLEIYLDDSGDDDEQPDSGGGGGSDNPLPNPYPDSGETEDSKCSCKPYIWFDNIKGKKKSKRTVSSSSSSADSTSSSTDSTDSSDSKTE